MESKEKKETMVRKWWEKPRVFCIPRSIFHRTSRIWRWLQPGGALLLPVFQSLGVAQVEIWDFASANTVEIVSSRDANQVLAITPSVSTHLTLGSCWKLKGAWIQQGLAGLGLSGADQSWELDSRDRLKKVQKVLQTVFEGPNPTSPQLMPLQLMPFAEAQHVQHVLVRPVRSMCSMCSMTWVRQRICAEAVPAVSKRHIVNGHRFFARQHGHLWSWCICHCRSFATEFQCTNWREQVCILKGLVKSCENVIQARDSALMWEIYARKASEMKIMKMCRFFHQLQQGSEEVWLGIPDRWWINDMLGLNSDAAVLCPFLAWWRQFQSARWLARSEVSADVSSK